MIESFQYNAALAITGAIRGTSREKLYKELGFESLHDRRWFRKLCFYYKIRHNMCPLYLTELFPIMKTHCHSLRSNRPPTVPNFRTELFKSTFPPLVLLIVTKIPLHVGVVYCLMAFNGIKMIKTNKTNKLFHFSTYGVQ